MNSQEDKVASQDDYARTALRLPRELHAAVHAAARAQDRSFNGQIVALLRAALAEGGVHRQGPAVPPPPIG